MESVTLLPVLSQSSEVRAEGLKPQILSFPPQSIKPTILPLHLNKHGQAHGDLDGGKQLMSLHSPTLLKQIVTVVESELTGSDLDDESDQASETSSRPRSPLSDDVVRTTFEDFKSQWVDDPIITQWRNPEHRVYTILLEVEKLYQEWSISRPPPFSPITDPLWLQTGQVLREVGLPWHNNQINMPDEIDTSWPFHFKSYETEVIKAKGRRVGDRSPSGYVCNWCEANCYGIRALQQELREKVPDHQPLLVYDHLDREIIKSAEKLFGLQSCHVDLSKPVKDIVGYLENLTSRGPRPILFAATLANAGGEYDNLDSICEISDRLPMILHMDTSRNFDYITTMSTGQRQLLGIRKLILGVQPLGQSILQTDGSVLASTIIAGGPNYTSPAPVVALKPIGLGSVPKMVAYTKASDSTLAGSRDALAPLWVALQETRFGTNGFRKIYQSCARKRTALVQALKALKVDVLAPVYSLDIVVRNCSATQLASLMKLGADARSSTVALLTIQPSVHPDDMQNVVDVFSGDFWGLQNTVILPSVQDFTYQFPVPGDIVDELVATVQSWKVATRSAAGYPFHMGSYSALGPVIGRFLDVAIRPAWIQEKAAEMIATRMESFGLLDNQSQSQFKGAFTNGSTMGNRTGVHTALTHFPDAFVYFSHESHYSVAKTVRDCDNLTRRWSDRVCRYAEIPCDLNGSMLVDKLVQQALSDKEYCRQRNEEYRLILFANMGTTFLGARENLREIRYNLKAVGIDISYIHVDGALDLGFSDGGVFLGPPGTVSSDDLPAVQGITVSHHKAMGNMVSGEVVCYSPGDQLATLGSSVDPRAVFETWLYLKVYSPSDFADMLRYCQSNASRLETGLKKAGVVTKRNCDSTITVLEKPPAWIVEEFSLRPEGDWVHFITMPHVSRQTVDLFVDRIAWVDRQCIIAFQYVARLLGVALAQPVRLVRVQCRQSLAMKVKALSNLLAREVPRDDREGGDCVDKYLSGAMSVVAIDTHNQVQAVFLAGSSRDRAIHVGPVLLKSHCLSNERMVLDVARQLFGFMGRLLYADIRTDNKSYALYSY